MARPRTSLIALTLLSTTLFSFSCGGSRKDSDPVSPSSIEQPANSTAVPAVVAAEGNGTPLTPPTPAPTPEPTPTPDPTQPPVVPPVTLETPPVVPVENDPVVTLPPVPTVNYALVHEKIFKPLCLSCHTAPRGRAGINLNTYAFVKANLAAVENAALVEKIMPPSSELEAESAALLKSWIEAGAPE